MWLPDCVCFGHHSSKTSENTEKKLNGHSSSEPHSPAGPKSPNLPDTGDVQSKPTMPEKLPVETKPRPNIEEYMKQYDDIPPLDGVESSEGSQEEIEMPLLEVVTQTLHQKKQEEVGF